MNKMNRIEQIASDFKKYNHSQYNKRYHKAIVSIQLYHLSYVLLSSSQYQNNLSCMQVLTHYYL